MPMIRLITDLIRRATTVAWTCQGGEGGGCGTNNPEDASNCTSCGRPW